MLHIRIHIALHKHGLTDYVFRGITQNGGEPALQAAIDYTHKSGIYVGVLASRIDFNDADGGRAEIDYYFGYRGTHGKCGPDRRPSPRSG
jgi:uncharacterized protein (TIGR02001 family)